MRVTSMANYFLRFKWTMRVIALIGLFMLTIANLVRIILSGLVDHHLSRPPPDSQAKARTS